MITSLPEWGQFVIWIISALVVVFGVSYYELHQIEKMDKKPNYYLENPNKFKKSTYILSVWYALLSIMILLTFKPGSSLTLLYSIYVGLSVPSLFQKGANWSKKLIDGLQNENILE